MAKALTAMSVEELEDAARAVNDKADAVRDERRAIQQEINRRHALAGAEALVQGLTDEQREALAQAVAPGGIPSSSSVGTVGG